MNYLEGQIEQTKAYVSYWQAMIVSGGYKNRKLYKPCGDNPEYNECKDKPGYRALTDEESLKEATDTMLRHCHKLGELIEHLSEK